MSELQAFVAGCVCTAIFTLAVLIVRRIFDDAEHDGGEG
jgi:nitrate reductase gamma subunit